MAKRSVAKPYAGGKWTEARARSFVTSALRRGHWPAKYAVLESACTGKRINTKTGRSAKHFLCNSCSLDYPAKEVAVDHIHTVVPIGGYPPSDSNVFGYDWNAYIAALLCEPPLMQVLCKECHHAKTQMERAARDAYNAQKKSTIQGDLFN